VNQFLIKAAQRVAPRTVNNLRTLRSLDQEFEQGPARFITYEREVWALRREVDELRRDNRRVAELYDAVFEWAKANSIPPPAVPGGPAAVAERVAAEFDDVE
jgi:uncharacterized protein DUF6752